MVRLIVALALLATPLAAESPMSGQAFEDYATGRTLTFGLPDGTPFGVEKYLPDRRVVWSPLDGTCTDGIWYDNGANICFLYENDPDPKCWEVFRTPSGIRAEFANRPSSTILFEAQENPEPLICGDLFS